MSRDRPFSMDCPGREWGDYCWAFTRHYSAATKSDLDACPVRHELATIIVDLLNIPASNSQLASLLRRAAMGEKPTDHEEFQFHLRSNALLRYWEDAHYQYRLGLYDEVEYSRQKEAWKATFATSKGLVNYWHEVRTL
jgi:hypothetical protein